MSISSIVYNTECIDGMRNWADKSFDLAICDIPYGIGVGNMPYLKAAVTIKQKNGKRLGTPRKNYKIKDWDTYVPGQRYFDELRRVSHDQIIFGIDYVDWNNVGPGRIIWDKCVAEGMSFSRYETAYCSLISTTTTIPLLWSGMQQAKSLKEPTTPQGDKRLNEKRIHPCQKPVLLYQKLLSLYGQGCDFILDTHVGSGSSRIAAELAGMGYVGFEVDREYWEKQEKRFNKFIRQLPLFERTT